MPALSFDHAEAERLYGAGMSIAAIAAQLGVKRNTVQTALRRRGVELKRVGGKSPYAPDVAKARRVETNRRWSTAQKRAWRDLVYRYPDEYRELIRVHHEGVMAERGPLPGDAL